jgi:outer membrane protein assembly factor BamB
MLTRTVVAVAIVLSTVSAFAGNWPAWRGPSGNGVSTETGLPTKWSATENVTWKVALPGEGNSVPIIWDNHIFVTCPIDDGKVRSLLCFDRKNGKQLWSVKLPFAQKETRHRDNPFCSGSPTTDGKLVYASFGSAGVIACDFTGKIVWQRTLGKLTHVFGNATTPVLYGDLLIIYRGPGESTNLLALNKSTGKTVWDTPQRGKNSNLFGSWATPVIMKVDGHDELIQSLPEEIKGFNPRTGKELWTCRGMGTEIYAMPAVGPNLIVGICGHAGPAMAVRPGGKGDVTKTHREWIVPRNQQRVGSGVIHKGYLYLSNATGIAECINVKTGESVWKERLGGTLWGSMLLADGKLYVNNQQGEFFVLDPSPKFKLIAKNTMGEHIKAAAAPSDGQLFLRTYKNLYCVGERTAE